MDTNPFSHIAIVTHESFAPSFNQCIVDDLTDYFLSVPNKVLHTYICVVDIASYNRQNQTHDSHATLVKQQNYVKTMVAETSQLRKIQSEVMIIICHGAPATRKYSASLRFCDEEAHVGNGENATIVWASATRKPAAPNTSVALNDVIGQSNIVILMCCDADDIVHDYFNEKGPKEKVQEILYFNGDRNADLSSEILLSLMINICDIEFRYHRRPFDEYLRPILLKIMQIVRLFETDSVSFWNFLETVGCVSMLEDVKRQQQLPNKWNESTYFRLNGRKLTRILKENTKEVTLNDMRALTLARWSAEGVHTCSVMSSDPPDIEFCDEHSDREPQVDEFLKHYKRNKPKLSASCIVSAQAISASPLVVLLGQLQRLRANDMIAARARDAY